MSARDQKRRNVERYARHAAKERERSIRERAVRESLPRKTDGEIANGIDDMRALTGQLQRVAQVVALAVTPNQASAARLEMRRIQLHLNRARANMGIES